MIIPSHYPHLNHNRSPEPILVVPTPTPLWKEPNVRALKLDEYHVYVSDDDFDTCMLVVCENREDLERKLPIDNYLQGKDIG